MSSNSGKNYDYSFERYSGILTANVEMNIHSPIGAIGMSLGSGPGYEFLKDDLGAHDHYFAIHMRGSMSYTVFLTENWFIRWFGTSMSPIRKHIKTRVGDITLTSIAGFEIGYYLPWVKGSLYNSVQ